jgi:glycosyltransferase involved in cell wall biosynthesis
MMISIIVPTLNSCQDLKLCINSLLNQTYSDKEIIIVDGGSTDETLIYLNQLIGNVESGNLKYISDSDDGIYDAMNKGIKIAAGEWLLFMGDDDKLISNNVLLSIFTNTNIDPSVSIIYGDGICNGDILYNTFSKKLLRGNSLNHQCTFYRHTIFKEIKYDIKYKIGADYKLNLLLYKGGFAATKLPLLISEHGSQGISYQNKGVARSEENLARVEILGVFIGTVLNMLVEIKYFLKDRIEFLTSL